MQGNGLSSPTHQICPQGGTKYSIKYQIYYYQTVQPGYEQKLRKIQVSLDKSKSLQYNLKKWVQRLKLVPPEATVDVISQFKLHKREGVKRSVQQDNYDDDDEIESSHWYMRQLVNKDFSQDDLLFMGRSDQLTIFREKMKQREMRRLTGDYDRDLLSEDEISKPKNIASNQLFKKPLVKVVSLVGEDVQVNDEDFEDMISLHSSGKQYSLSSGEDSSIMEVQQQNKQGVRKRGRPPKNPNMFMLNNIQAQSAVAHTISSTSVHNQEVSSEDNNSLIVDDDDDYTGFDELGGVFSKKFKITKTQPGRPLKIFQATKIDPLTVTYSQITTNKPIMNLNELNDDQLESIRRYLDHKKIFEYRYVVQVMNQDIFEKHFKFTAAIDCLPTLDQDGSQTMIIRCFKHHQQVTNNQQKPIQQKLDSPQSEDLFDFIKCSDRSRSIFDDNDDSFNPSFQKSVLCPLLIRMQTTVDGYWQLMKDINAESICIHQPLLQAQPPLKKPQKVNKEKFDDVLNQKGKEISKNTKRSEFELFNEEFGIKDNNVSNLVQLNQKQKKINQPISMLFMDDGQQDNSTKPSISPEEKSVVNDVNLSNDEFFSSTFKISKENFVEDDQKIDRQEQTVLDDILTPFKQEAIQQLPNLQRKPQPNTIQVADNVMVDVIDSKHFLNIVNSSTAHSAPQKVNFKRNISQKMQQLEHLKSNTAVLSQDGNQKLSQSNTKNWFINEEERIFQGNDYVTQNEEMHKLLKFLKASFSKNDFYRFEPGEKEIKTLIFATQQMKERYLIYRDVIMICPCLTSQTQSSGISADVDGHNRFKDHLALGIYGINSNGRNIILSIALVTPGDQSSFDFALKAFFFYMGKLPKALILERNQFGFDYIQVSLPFVDDPEELELKLREVQKINWGQAQPLENLKDFLKRLSTDRVLWAQCYRLIPQVKFEDSSDPNRPQQIPIFSGDFSVCQRNISIECYMSNYLIIQGIMGDFQPKESLRLFSRLDEIDVSYTNESKLVASQQIAKFDQNIIFKNYVKTTVPIYIQQRFKFQMQKSINYSLLDESEDQSLMSQTSQNKNQRNWTVCHADRKLSYKVTLNHQENGHLRCNCGFSTISGIPCSHEFWLCNYLTNHHSFNQQPSKNFLKFRYRWLSLYEEENRAKLHRAEDGLMYIHKQLNFTMPEHKNTSNSESVLEFAPQVVTRQSKKKASPIVAPPSKKPSPQDKLQASVEKLAQLPDNIPNSQQNLNEDDDSDCELHISNDDDEPVVKLEESATDQSSKTGIKIQIPLHQVPTQQKVKRIYMKSESKSKAKKKKMNVAGGGPGKRKKDSENEYGSEESDIEKYRQPISNQQKNDMPKEMGQIESKTLPTKRQAKQKEAIKQVVQRPKRAQKENSKHKKEVEQLPSQQLMKVNPKIRFQKAGGSLSQYMFYSQSNQSGSNFAPFSQSQYSLNLSNKPPYSKSKYQEDDESDGTESILNLDDLLCEHNKNQESKVRACYSQNAQLSSEDPILVYHPPKGSKIPNKLEGWAGPNIFRGIHVVENQLQLDTISVELRNEPYQKINQMYNSQSQNHHKSNLLQELTSNSQQVR